jgi:transglutaminase-like putative cysteine protease
VTAAFFFGLPRVQGGVGAGAAAASLSGFSEEVALGDLGPILDNPDVVLTATLRAEGGGPVPPGPYRFRALAHDHFDGLRWRHTIGLNPNPAAGGGALPAGASVLHQEITLEPLTDGVLPAIAQARRLSAPGEVVQLDGNGNYRLRGVRGPVTYRVESVLLPDGVALPPGAAPTTTGRAFQAALRAGVWTSLPPGLDPRITALADALAAQAGPSPRARAAATVEHLAGNLAYTAVPMPGDARRPLADFLFETRRGHCEYFATALVVLLRAQGIPARLVSGFYTNEVNTLGGFAVARQQDAHAWAEAWIDGEGWLTLDATPAAPGRAEAPLPERVAQVLLAGWRNAVLDYDMGAQFSLAQRLLSERPGGPIRAGDGLRAVALAVLALAAMGALRRGALAWSVRRRVAPGPVAAAWRRAQRQVEKAGWTLPPGSPPVEAAEWLVRVAGPAAAPLQVLAWAWYAVRYEGVPEADVLPRVRAAEAALRALPRRTDQPAGARSN